MTIKNLLSHMSATDHRLRIYEPTFFDEPDDDGFEFEINTIFFDDHSLVPDDLLNRKIKYLCPDDEYVNCILIELKDEK